MLIFCSIFGQVIFAELQGSPDMDISGWNIAGAAYTGDTGGDTDNFNNELILTEAVNSTSGAIFYSEPIDLGTCNQWNVKFDFRMYEGSAADGIAFCFLDVGRELIMANGITYNNCGGKKIQIYSGPGIIDAQALIMWEAHYGSPDYSIALLSTYNLTAN